MSASLFRWILIAAFAVTAVVPTSDAHAQLRLVAIPPTGAAVSSVSADIANRLQNVAYDIMQHNGTRVSRADAGSLLRQAGLLRGPDDASYVRDFVNATICFIVSEHWREARETAEIAARRALQTGDAYESAYAFMSASILAKRLGQGKEAQELARTALEIGRHGTLEPKDRAAILARIDLRNMSVTGGPEELP
jgi:hypothetical protein